MDIVTWFWIAFFLTVLSLVAALASGLMRRRRVHLVAGPATLVFLTVAILLTERLARARAFPPEELAIHLWFAKTGAALALPVILTGLLLVWFPRVRGWHRLAVVLFAVGVLAATGTGLWVFALSEPA